MRSSEPPPHQHAAPSVVASCLSNSRITSALWRYSHPLHVVAGAGLAPTPASVLGRTLLSSLQCLQHVLQQLLRQLRPPRSPCCPPPPLPPLECHHDQKTLNPVKTGRSRGEHAQLAICTSAKPPPIRQRQGGNARSHLPHTRQATAWTGNHSPQKKTSDGALTCCSAICTAQAELRPHLCTVDCRVSTVFHQVCRSSHTSFRFVPVRPSTHTPLFPHSSPRARLLTTWGS
jgi:hypothetical protein